MPGKRTRKTSSKQLSTINPDAAGLDVGSTFHVVAVPPDRDEMPVRTFRTFSGDLHQLADWLTQGADLSQIHGFGPTVLRLVAECGDDMRKWPTAKHFTSWLCLAPGNKISGGRLLSSKTRPSANRAAILLRIAAVNIGRTQTARGAFYRRVAGRVGKAKAVTATARKLAILFYNALRFGMTYVDPGVAYYEERYRQRVIHKLHRRARDLGFSLVPNSAASAGVEVS